MIHLLTENSIEERVWQTLTLKKELFSGLFDLTADEVTFEKLGRRSTLELVKEVLSEEPPRPEAGMRRQGGEVAPALETGLPRDRAEKGGEEAPPQVRVSVSPPPAAHTSSTTQDRGPGGRETAAAPDATQAAANLLEAGLRFLESIAPRQADVASRPAQVEPLGRVISALFRTEPQTQRPILAIPLPESFTAERLVEAIRGLLNKLAGSVAQ